MSKHGDGGAIVVSMGEPAGIGPEIAVKAWSALHGKAAGRPIQLIGDPDVFCGVAKSIGCKIPDSAFVDTGHRLQISPGTPSPENAGAVTVAIEQGVRLVTTQHAAALVTAPIHKAVLTKAGFAFPGHTEFLASLTGVKQAVMMLASLGMEPPLRVVPFTIHVALKDIFQRLDVDAITATGEIVLQALKQDFGIERPRLAIAGLNPHAGEDGTMGSEDRDILAPAAANLRAKGYDISGPLAADTLFHADARKTYDGVLCMYHDQALIPIKTLAFWNGVNVTLGLPIVRTSPDHGTALGIAGKGVANEASMISAIQMAADIATRRGL